MWEIGFLAVFQQIVIGGPILGKFKTIVLREILNFKQVHFI